MPFGAFVQVGEGIEGLVHISEMAEHHVEAPEQVVTPGEELWVKIIDIDLERRRISLSIKQAAEGGEVAAEYREFYGEHAYDEQGNYIGPDYLGDRRRRGCRRCRDADGAEASAGAGEASAGAAEASAGATRAKVRPRPRRRNRRAGPRRGRSSGGSTGAPGAGSPRSPVRPEIPHVNPESVRRARSTSSGPLRMLAPQCLRLEFAVAQTRGATPIARGSRSRKNHDWSSATWAETGARLRKRTKCKERWSHGENVQQRLAVVPARPRRQRARRLVFGTREAQRLGDLYGDVPVCEGRCEAQEAKACELDLVPAQCGAIPRPIASGTTEIPLPPAPANRRDSRGRSAAVVL